jgi:hypothetical protein
VAKFGFLIPAIPCDVGDSGDLHPSPHASTRILKGLHDPIPTGPIHARFSRGWQKSYPDWRIVQRLASIWRTVQKKSCSCSMTFLSVPSCHLWLIFPITRNDGDSLRLAQFSPRRKHETVHRSSAFGVRIRRHTRGHLAGDFCSTADWQMAIFR